MSCRPFLLLVGALWLAACASAPAQIIPDDEPIGRLYVTSNDWHVLVAVARTDIGLDLLPELADLPDPAYVAIGWGDYDYYPEREPSIGLAIRAALLPSPAVIHLIPMADAPRSVAGLEVLAVEIPEGGLRAMLEAIDAAVRREGAPRAPVAAPGLHPDSLFFPAEGTYHVFNTSNKWIARKLVAAGLPIRTWDVITAESLMRRLRPLPVVEINR